MSRTGRTPPWTITGVILLAGVLPLATTFIPTDSTMASWLLAATLGVGFALLAPPTGGTPVPVRYALVAAACAFCAAGALSATPALSLLGRYPRYEGLATVAGYAFALVAGARLLGSSARAERRLFLSATAVAALVTALACLVQVLLDPDARVIGLLGNSSVLGAWALVALAMLGWQLLVDRRPLLVGGFVAAFCALVLSASRAAWLAAVVALAGTLVVRLWSQPRPRAWIPLSAVGVLTVAVLLVPATQARLTGKTPFAAATAHGRLLLWEDSLRLWQSRPLVGAGPSSFVDAVGIQHTPAWAAAVGPYAPPDSPHNVVLQVLTATGVLGLLGLVAVAACTLAVLWSCRPWDPWQAGAITAALGAGVALLFSFTDPVAITVLMVVVGGALARAPGTRRRWSTSAERVALGVWLCAALALSGSAIVAEWRLSAALDTADPDRLVAAARTRAWDPDLAIRTARVLNTLAETEQSPAHRAAQLLDGICPAVPGSTECLQTLGDAETLAGDPARALKTLHRALQLDPTNVDTMLKLGIAAAEAGSASTAESWFRRAAQLRPTAAEPWHNLAALYRRSGRDAEAEAAETTAERLSRR